MSSPLRPQNPVAPSVRAKWPGAITPPRHLPPVQIDPSQPAALGPDGGKLVALPGANYPPAGATPVDVIGDGNIAPGASAVLVTVTVPDTLTFVMAGIGFGADDETALGFLTWSLRANGDTLPGYVGTPAAIGSIRQLADIVTVVGSSGVVTVVAASSASAVLTYRFICRVRGYFYAEKAGH